MSLSREELISELARLADELGTTPTKREMMTHGKYSTSAYQDRFGSWNAAILAAGLEPNLRQHNQIPRDELLDELQRLADELGRTPKTTEMKKSGEFSPHTYKERFGSWNDSVEAAGLESKPKGPQIPRDDLIEKLQCLADELEKTPSTADMNAQGEFNDQTYTNRFGSWTEAVEAAGLDPNDRFEKISRRELIAELQRLADERGETPTTSDMDDDGEFSAGTYINRFGSWSAAIEAANIEFPE